MIGWDPRQLRRIVTGIDANGRVNYTEGTPPTIKEDPGSPGTWIAEAWVTDAAPPSLDGADLADRAWELEPPPGGSAFRIFQLPPRNDSGHAGTFHFTETIDYVVVLSGRMWLVVDGGEVELRQGDCVVQRGTNHAWENRGPEPCVAVGVLISARPGGAR